MNMTSYSHFAFSSLYLLNGYKEVRTHRGVEMEYAQEEELELCIRRLVLRKVERLSGWDLRFLRRGLALTQAALGELVDRDAQTVARWEKSGNQIPRSIDLAIRIRFAAAHEPQLTTDEILRYVDGNGRKLPESIYLRLTQKGWRFELEPTVKFAKSTVAGSALIRLGRGVGATCRVLEDSVHEKTQTFLIEKLPDGRITVSHGQSATLNLDSLAGPLTDSPKKLQFSITGSANDYASATTH